MKLSELVIGGLIVGGAVWLVGDILAPRTQGPETPVLAEVEAPASQPAPEQEFQLSATAAMLKLENDGHYWASAAVDGTAVRFMVDTGASTVALTYNDAQRIGIRLAPEDFRWTINTAGGEVMGASVRLDEISIGRVTVRNVEAMVLREGLTQSLLGMTFLSQLESYEFRRGHLIMRQ
ncbi:MAG: TIGR02281 family clan AA aspartic protease [Pseudomonadota bacterium]